MRFDPVYFINLCQQSGFTLTREGGFLCYSYEGRKIKGYDFFVETMRQHKAALLPLLADSREVQQIDLFDDYSPP